MTSTSDTDVRDVQQALGHKYLDTTMGYVRPAAERVRSPLDALNGKITPLQTESEVAA